MTVHVYFKFAHVLKFFKIHIWLNRPLTIELPADESTECDGGLVTVLLNADESTGCERQIASGEIDDAYVSTSAEQRNSPRLARPGIMLKNRTHSL